MIRFKLQACMAALGFRQQRRVTIEDVAEATGIHRTTLGRMNRPTGTSVTTDNLDRLCHYLGCSLEELAEYVPSEPPAPRRKSRSSAAASD